MDLGGKELALPLNLSPQDAACFQTPMVRGVLYCDGAKTIVVDETDEHLLLPVSCVQVYFSTGAQLWIGNS